MCCAGVCVTSVRAIRSVGKHKKPVRNTPTLYSNRTYTKCVFVYVCVPGFVGKCVSGPEWLRQLAGVVHEIHGILCVASIRTLSDSTEFREKDSTW